MITTDFQYIFLNLLMMTVFIFTGRFASKDEKNYWKYAIWCVIAFTLVLGLRYGRGNDYFRYVTTYIREDDKDQRLFTWFNYFLREILGIGRYYFFVIYSFIFVLCAMISFKEYRQYIQWLFPLFLIAFTYVSEYTIRQGLGYSFIFLFTMYLMKDEWEFKKKLPYLVGTFLAAFSIHSANAINAVIFLSVYYFFRKPITPLISIPCVILATFVVGNIFDFNWLSPLLSFIGDVDSKYSHYADNSERWFSAESSNDALLRNSIIQLWQTWGECSLLYLGYKTINKYNATKIAIFYNVYWIGFVIWASFITIEILNRMGYSMYVYWIFPLAAVLYKMPKWSSIPFIYKFCYIGLTFYAYEYLKYLFLRTREMYHFIWDIQ